MTFTRSMIDHDQILLADRNIYLSKSGSYLNRHEECIMALQAAGKKRIQDFIENGKPFKTESMEGTFEYRGHGRYPNYQIFDLSKGEAWIYSYDTPIAVKHNGKWWWVPEVHYSNTTTNHQNVVRTALRQNA